MVVSLIIQPIGTGPITAAGRALTTETTDQGPIIGAGRTMEIMVAIMGLTTGSGVTMMTMAVALTMTITDPTTEDLVIMTTLGAGLIMTTTALTMDGATMTADLPTEITAQTTMAGGVTTARLTTGEATTDHQTIGEVDRLTTGETMETPPPTQTCNPPRLYLSLIHI